MIDSALHFIASSVLSIIQTFGYGGVFFLMALESANIPIPSEIIMPFAGFLVSKGVFSFWVVVMWGTVGNYIGSLLSYVVAERIMQWRASWSVLKIFLREEELNRASRWFNRWGIISVFFSRMLPVIRTFISFPAGIARMRLLPFSVFTVSGSFLWSLLLTWVGYFLGEKWNILQPYFHMIDMVVIGCVVVFAGSLFFAHRRKKLKSV